MSRRTRILAGTPYENPNNPKNEYDPDSGAETARRGWLEQPRQPGQAGQERAPLQLEMLYDTKTFEPHLTIYQEDLRKVGNHSESSPDHSGNPVPDGEPAAFQMAIFAWGGVDFPGSRRRICIPRWPTWTTPTTSPGSRTRASIDLLKQYDQIFDIDAPHSAFVREIDGILANAYQYVLLWDAPFTRVLYWNKFGTPPGYHDAHRRLLHRASRCGGSIPAKNAAVAEGFARSFRETRSRAHRGSLLARLREDAADVAALKTSQRCVRIHDWLFRPPLPADHSDVHRHHAGRVSW